MLTCNYINGVTPNTVSGGSNQFSLFDIKGKVALVSGGGSGIGLGISAALIKHGAKVYICSRDFKKCEATAQELTKIGPGTCIAIAADISKVDQLVWFGLVNNSGCNWAAELEEFPDSGWDKVMNLNVKAVFNLTVACLPLLRVKATNADPSRVINIGSIDGIRIPSLDTYSYSASKAAVHQLTKTLANRLAHENITVNAIAAGPFMSKMTKVTFEKFHDAVTASVALGRMGDNEDLEGITIFLSSKARWREEFGAQI
ncbi:Rhamnolipids biosynthesis 3-oxoacyl-[acyl-carrier protein] reductase [Heterostelium album PN500]|uniref:Rhamnolipids biosynthesis 3-oxoacyl-[acyl-carrier protein] reductase n=1 Tax=Heterostelium pallidum (strain ATCC 26659 / Pp 5 / PN500) TaxID=670386 RepID=D3BH67_HETP5|nr:Rhamnolipids biosynthesis 3-oxoacyl-[acyl-carrier protein] reductase [Heterostelium album PN500]EFA79451.1 Rhamnolipids biosynthesis 3-oxoacyl-[acyl-carrier protein] reductase [Heterostelium album PN500]|eukprot:XP_020431572.1 Rhamnolipids biosynthesis 3-oxoacyl-[acyl-carrier protein] reductase [Heterostelium album PN500]